MTGKVLIWLAALYDLALAIFHLMLGRLLQWRERLPASGRVNAAATQTLNVMMIYVMVAYAACLVWQLRQTGETPFLLLLAGGGFWVLRLTLQPVFFSPPGSAIRPYLVLLFGVAVHLAAALA